MNKLTNIMEFFWGDNGVNGLVLTGGFIGVVMNWENTMNIT